VKDFINMVANESWTLWVFCSIAIDLRRRLPDRLVNVCRRIFFESRPFSPLALIAMHASSSLGAWQWFFTGINITCWLVLRLKKDDDDRWRKRGKKLAEKVQQQGARLVVVPASGGQR
jgi:hypothetical protein